MITDDLEAGYSTSSVRRHVIVLRSILDAAIDDGRLRYNVTEGVRLPPESARRMRFLQPAQVVTLASAIRPTFYATLIYVAAYIGLRWGELAGLRIDRVDLLRHTITIDSQMTEVAGRLEFGPPKSKAGYRQVTIPPTISELLGPHLGSWQCRRSGLAFPTVNRHPMRRGNFRKIWRRTVDGDENGNRPALFPGLGLDGLVFHELRHTAAALAIEHGAHPLTIKERLGHSSITVTMDTYGHLFPAQDQALAAALDGTLRRSLAGDMQGDRTTVRPLPRSADR
jgi:integrase